MFAARNIARVVISNVRNKHTLPELPYAYEALEPVISRDIMCLHHQKHHAAYVNNLNVAEDKLKAAVEKGDHSAAVAQFSAYNFNGGGHINHSIFWQNLSPHPSSPSRSLCTAISDNFGSMEKFRELFQTKTVSVMGSGWGWLGYCPTSGCLKIQTMANQDALQPLTGLIPLLGIDVWEHAYYLQYKNVRADYVKAIWDIINWEDVSARYAKASGKPAC